MYWGIFDFQYEKEVYMQNPSLYRIGINKEEFNARKYWGWYTFAFY